jgi:hypothetical protein
MLTKIAFLLKNIVYFNNIDKYIYYFYNTIFNFLLINLVYII